MGQKTNFIYVSAIIWRPCMEKSICSILVVKWVKETGLRWNSNSMCRATYRMYSIPGFKFIYQNMKNRNSENFSWRGALLTPPFECFWPPQGHKFPDHDGNQYGSRHLLYAYVHQIGWFYTFFEGTDEEKWLLPIFGCKVGQDDPIVVKL